MRNEHKLLAWLNALIVIGFSIHYFRTQNYEFVIYVGVIIFLYFLILLTLHRSKFDSFILWGLSVWAWLHMAGGGIVVGEGVLYGLHLIPIAGEGDTFILKFDQFVHAFGFGMSTLVVYHLLKAYLGSRVNYKVLYPIIVLAGMGVGALNELLEFIVVLLVPSTGVGGYDNTMIDIVFNTIGAIIAAIVIHLRRTENAIQGGR